MIVHRHQAKLFVECPRRKYSSVSTSVSDIEIIRRFYVVSAGTGVKCTLSVFLARTPLYLNPQTSQLELASRQSSQNLFDHE